MLNIQNIKNLTDLRLNPAMVAKLAKTSQQPVYIFNRSKPTSVILDIKKYQELIEKIENLVDSLEIKNLKKKSKKSDFLTNQQLKKQLGIK